MSNKKQLTPNQEALEVLAQLIQKTMGAGLFKDFRSLDVVRGAFTQVSGEIGRLAELDKKPGNKHGSANKSE